MKKFVKLLCGPLINRALRDTDSQLQILRKSLLIPVLIAASIPIMVQLAVKKRMVFTFVTALLILIQASTVVPLVVLFKYDVTEGMLLFIAVCSSLAVMCSDMSSVVLSSGRTWSLFVIVIDVLLLCRARHSTSALVICICCFHLVLMASESVLRFGLFDFDWDGYEQEARRKAYDCDNLPCPESVSLIGMHLTAQVFISVVDFSCTRGFAYGMAEEQNRVLASIRTANEIATSLAGFDLIQAGVLLEESKIPPELRVAFEKLLNNLRTYQPYLPQSCIPRSAESSSASSGSPAQSVATDQSPLTTPCSGVQVDVRKPFQQCNASLMVININNSMSVLDHSLESFEKLISALVSTTFDNVMKYKGTPDLFLGDRMFANFGASLQRSRHAHACFDCCTEVLKSSASLLDPFQELTSKRLSINVGTATGQIACGDLGSDTMLRFSLVGKLSQWVAVIERVGSFLGIQFLSNESFHKQVTETTESRVVLQTVLCGGETHILYEIIPQLKSVKADEWMYQLENAGVWKWVAFNIVAIAVLKGLPIPQDHVDVCNCGGDVYDELRHVINHGIPPSLVVKDWELAACL